MKELIKRLNGWSKILVAMIPMLVGGLIGYGKLQGNVSSIKENMAGKERVAILETTVARNSEIIRELKALAEKNNDQHNIIIEKVSEIKALVRRNR